MLEKGFLGSCAMFWMGYGIFCLFWPDTVAGFIGYQYLTADTRIEVISMYGGLEFGVGVMFLYCMLQEKYHDIGLLMVICIIGGLALARTVAFLVLGGEVTIYTYGGIFYEGVSAAIAALLLWKRKNAATS